MRESEQAGRIERTVRAFICAGHLHRGAVDGARETMGLHRSQHMLLLYLAHHEDAPTQKQIAEEFEISSAAVAVTLSKLEGMGFVERGAGDDNRCKHVRLTEKGKEILAATGERFREADRNAFRGFSDEELDTFRQYLERMSDNLRG